MNKKKPKILVEAISREPFIVTKYKELGEGRFVAENKDELDEIQKDIFNVGKAEGCNLSLEIIKRAKNQWINSGYGHNHTENCQYCVTIDVLEAIEEELCNTQLPTSSNKDTSENNQVADERRKLNCEKGRLYSSNSKSSSPEMELKVSSVGSNSRIKLRGTRNSSQA